MGVIAIAAAVVEPWIAVDDDRRHVEASRVGVADAAGPVFRHPLLELELERIEIGVERRTEFAGLLLVELGEGAIARRCRNERAAGIEDRDTETGDPAVRPDRPFVDVDHPRVVFAAVADIVD